MATEQTQTVRCPDGPDPLGGDIVGCGEKFEAAPDDEGLVDCPHCGIVFNPDREGRLA
jgi:hypothetical protein